MTVQIPELLKLFRRKVLFFAIISIVGWALLALTFICWDGIDSAGRPIGACEPIGGNISWLMVPVAAYLLVGVLVRPKKRGPRS